MLPPTELPLLPLEPWRGDLQPLRSLSLRWALPLLLFWAASLVDWISVASSGMQSSRSAELTDGKGEIAHASVEALTCSEATVRVPLHFFLIVPCQNLDFVPFRLGPTNTSP